MLGYLDASSFFMIAIQAFWLVALAAADRIAISPLLPISLAIRSTSTWAMPWAVAWLTKRLRQPGLVSESNVTTLVPAVMACLIASQGALGSSAEMTRALKPCCAAVLMNGT